MNKVYPHTEIPTIFEGDDKKHSTDVLVNDEEGNMHVLWYSFTSDKWRGEFDTEPPPTEFTWMYKPEEFGEGVG